MNSIVVVVLEDYVKSRLSLFSKSFNFSKNRVESGRDFPDHHYMSSNFQSATKDLKVCKAS